MFSYSFCILYIEEIAIRDDRYLDQLDRDAGLGATINLHLMYETNEDRRLALWACLKMAA